MELVRVINGKIMFVALVAVLMFTSTTLTQCPSKCHCTRYKTFCKIADLNTLPSGLPRTMEFLKIELDHIIQLNSSTINHSGLSNLTCLILTSVQLQEIQPGSFQRMNLLESLTITHNNIAELKSDTFKFLHNLYFLNLAENFIFLLNSGSFSGLVNLRHLDLSFNIIEHLEANIFHSMKNSSYCDVIKTPSIFDLSANNIQFVESGVFQDLCTFTNLILEFRSENISKDIFVGLTRVTQLTVIFQNVKKLSNFLNSLSGLIELEIFSGLTPMKEIETKAFENLQSLRTLDLSANSIHNIESDVFKGINSLKILSLNSNNITKLNNNVFQYLESLQTLNMWSCKIHVIEPGAFNGLTQLQILNLERNKIITLKNNTFSMLRMLRVLNLDENKIKIIETGAFSGLWSLKILSHQFSDWINDVDYDKLNNEITTQKVTFETLGRLESFELRGFVKRLQGIQVLKSLNLYMNATSSNLHQQLHDIIKNVYNVTQFTVTLVALNSTENLAALSTFQFSNLNIQESSFLVLKNNTFFSFSKLESLTIGKCGKLAIERNAFNKIQSLTKITILFNHHVKIEFGSFSGLHNLKYLYVYNNQINFLEKGIFLGLDNLKYLNFRNNSINSLGIGNFQGLDNIKKIILSLNNIKEINAGVFGAICEREFQLSCKNASASSPYCNATNALKTLQYLDLSFNNIANIHPHAFISCTNLQTLDLSNNELLTLSNSFLFIPELRNLYLYGSNIRYIANNTFECTPTLSFITLSLYNTSFNVTPLLPLRELQTMQIILNMCVHDCALYETWIWLHEHHIDFFITENDYDFVNRDDISISLLNINCNNTLRHVQNIHKSINSKNDFLFFKQYIEPIILVIILTSGLVSNGFLLFISLYHSDMRNKQNTSVIHLAIVDILSLILNLPLSYADVINVTWELDETMCKIFIISKDIMMGTSVLSIVALSLERFLVARTFNSLKSHCAVSQNIPTVWFLFMIWISAIVLSLPSYFSATVDIRCLYCPSGNGDYIKRVWTFQFIIYCLLPTIIITFLNVKTSNFIKESICKIPGEIKTSYITRNRKTAANVVLILAILFFICYTPNFILRVLVSWSILDIENLFLISFFSFCLFFCITICNPISLFIMSHKFKTHALKYFPISNKLEI